MRLAHSATLALLVAWANVASPIVADEHVLSLIPADASCVMRTGAPQETFAKLGDFQASVRRHAGMSEEAIAKHRKRFDDLVGDKGLERDQPLLLFTLPDPGSKGDRTEGPLARWLFRPQASSDPAGAKECARPVAYLARVSDLEAACRGLFDVDFIRV